MACPAPRPAGGTGRSAGRGPDPPPLRPRPAPALTPAGPRRPLPSSGLAKMSLQGPPPPPAAALRPPPPRPLPRIPEAPLGAFSGRCARRRAGSRPCAARAPQPGSRHAGLRLLPPRKCRDPHPAPPGRAPGARLLGVRDAGSEARPGAGSGDCGPLGAGRRDTEALGRQESPPGRPFPPSFLFFLCRPGRARPARWTADVAGAAQLPPAPAPRQCPARTASIRHPLHAGPAPDLLTFNRGGGPGRERPSPPPRGQRRAAPRSTPAARGLPTGGYAAPTGKQPGRRRPDAPRAGLCLLLRTQKQAGLRAGAGRTSLGLTRLGTAHFGSGASCKCGGADCSSVVKTAVPGGGTRGRVSEVIKKGRFRKGGRALNRAGDRRSGDPGGRAGWEETGRTPGAALPPCSAPPPDPCPRPRGDI
ncbi:PREDICTED: translation initiation factor IF-2-like [Chinchilla lanigera]|uniref:translation initiation factor IF-2-like n=1 Tax=Chinchilla lanigera TaxID=34839 RepID=UPI000697F92D|nr:PREDICTED: translation initiation factor IF-2-like [Chinchilla lanigera]